MKTSKQNYSKATYNNENVFVTGKGSVFSRISVNNSVNAMTDRTVLNSDIK